MKKPFIILFDSDPFYKINLDLILNPTNNEIALAATTPTEINQLIKKIEAGEVKPDLAIVSNYIVKGWEDGDRIGQRLKAINKDIQILSYSIFKEKPEWADEHAVKSGLDNEATIVAALKKILNLDLIIEKKDTYD